MSRTDQTAPLPQLCHELHHCGTSYGFRRRNILRALKAIAQLSPLPLAILDNVKLIMGEIKALDKLELDRSRAIRTFEQRTGEAKCRECYLLRGGQ